MFALLLSVSLGLGVWLLYEGLTNPPDPQDVHRAWSERLQGMEEFLARAGLHDVTPKTSCCSRSPPVC